MSNMSYCRFHNTHLDLQDVQEHFRDRLDKGSDEALARASILRICKKLAEYDQADLPLRLPGEPEEDENE